MPIVSLARVNLSHPPGDLGDRLALAYTTFISGDEWHMEANFHYGTIGDVALYRNTNAHAKGSQPNWVWYGAIPTANIKGYILSNPPPASAVAVTNEPQTETQTKETVASVGAAE